MLVSRWKLALYLACGTAGVGGWLVWRLSPSPSSRIAPAGETRIATASEGAVQFGGPAPPPLLGIDWPSNAPAYFDPDLIDPELAGGTVHADRLIITQPLDPAIPGSAQLAPPAQLPDPGDATPIDARTAEAARELEALVDRELTELSDADRDVWVNVLQGMPIEQAREILQIWKVTGRPEKSAAGFVESPAATPSHSLPAPVHDAPDRDASGSPRPPALDWMLDNIRHIATPGYRRRQPGADGRLLLDLTPAEIRHTANPFHLAIEGPGFFVLRRGEQTVLTRAGEFDLGSDGTLLQRRSDGDWVLQPTLCIPPGTTGVRVTDAGDVEAVAPTDERGARKLGEIQLATCLNPQHLAPFAGALLTTTEASGPLHTARPGSSGLGRLRQGALEQSNATLALERANIERVEAQLELQRRAARLEGGLHGLDGGTRTTLPR